MKPSRLVTSGGVRHHTGRGMKKITKAALMGGAAAAAIAATVGVAAPAAFPGYCPERRWRISLATAMARPIRTRRQLTIRSRPAGMSSRLQDRRRRSQPRHSVGSTTGAGGAAARHANAVISRFR